MSLSRGLRLLSALVIFLPMLAISCTSPGPTKRIDLLPGLRISGSIGLRSTIVQEQILVPTSYVSLGADSPGTMGPLAVLLLRAAEDWESRRRSREAENLVAPLLQALPDLDVRSLLWGELQTAFLGVEGLDVARFEKRTIQRSPSGSDSRMRSLLELETVYFLENDASVFHLQTKVRYLEKGKREPSFLASLAYECGLADVVGSDAIERWAADDGARFREAVGEGVARTVAMLLADLGLSGRVAIGHSSAFEGMVRDMRGNLVVKCGQSNL